MYKLHLILKYLRKRRIAWVALLAVTLCTAMVLVVISVMGGWLRMFRTSFHGLSGDVVVQVGSLSGFPYYQEIISDIERLPEVEAAAPTIQTFGLVNIGDRKTMGVQVIGYPMERIVKVNDFGHSLWRQYNQPIEEAEEKKQSSSQVDAIRKEMDKKTPSFNLLPDIDYRAAYKWVNPRAKPNLVEEVTNYQGMIAGIGVFNIRKESDGRIGGRDEYLHYRLPIKLTVLGVSATGNFDVSSKAERNFWLVDTSRTKVWQYDSNTVYVPFDVLQKDLGMDEQQAEQDGKPFTIPARTREIHVRLKKPWRDSSDGLIAVRDKVQGIVDKILDAKDRSPQSRLRPVASTWEQSQAKWLGAIEKEMVLMIFLFGMISVVAVFLIFCIFYMIVAEKTRDIGIIKSVGATSSGVAGIFLGYGAVIGLVGAGAGFGIGYLVVTYINNIHAWLGSALHVVVWDPEVYAFDTIPNTMDPVHVTRILVAAVLASVLGAVIPAIRAARMNPVEALRWE